MPYCAICGRTYQSIRMASDCCMHLFREDKEIGPPGVYTDEELLTVLTEVIATHHSLNYKQYLIDWLSNRFSTLKKIILLEKH